MRNGLIVFLLVSLVMRVNAQDDGISSRPSILDSSAYQWTLIADGFDNPVGLTFIPDNSGRLAVWEQGGMIWMIEPNGSVPFEPFLDISGLLPQAVFRGGYSEQGLLGVAFDPNYAENRRFFIHYTDEAGDTVIARYLVSADDALVAEAQGAVILITVDQPFDNHNGGQLAFGPDGYLYIGLGDGGDQGDPFNNAQSPDTLLGKILRIDVSGERYAPAPTNPFSRDATFAPEVWAMGFRNPWRFSFDRATGDLYIADVGEWQWEEVNFQPADSTGGENYGWSLLESNLVRDENADPEAYTRPIAEYPHTIGCAVSGGYVYRGSALPDAQGVYFFGDYCNGSVWNAWRDEGGGWQSGLFMSTGRQITSFGEDQYGELYMVDYKGDILRLDPAATTP
jgi:glucose/arabinose dehydrogenase